MRKSIAMAAMLAALLWSAAVWAVVANTEVTITENGKPVDGATITLSEPKPPATQTASRPKRKPTATRTDSAGKTTVTYDDEDARAGWLVDIIVRRRDGSTSTVYGVPLSSLASGRPIDIAATAPAPRAVGMLPGYFWGVDLGGGFLRGIKDPPVNNETLRSRGSGLVFGAHFGTCALAVLACLEANIRNGESGKSQEVAGFQLRTRKAMILALALAMPFPVGNNYYVRPFIGLGYGRFTSEVGNFRATDWMPMWHAGLAFGTMIQTALGPSLLEIYWRYDDTFGRQDVTLGRIEHSNQFIGVRVSFPFGNAVAASDARLKHDVAEVGRLPNGIALYRYRYLWSDTQYVGVMAQEAAAVAPDAVVVGADGFLRVDYGKLGTRLMTWDEWRGPSLNEMANAAF